MSDDLHRRLRRLELENRLHRVVFVAFGLAALQCGGVTSNFELVRTQRLDLVDGADRVVLTVSAARGGEITFRRSDGDVTLDAATVAAARPASAQADRP